MGAKELDALYISLGVCGWFPMGIWIVHMLANACSCFLYFGNSMATYQPRFWCSDLSVYFNSSDDDDQVDQDANSPFPERLVNLSKVDICSIGCPGSNWSFEEPTEHSMASEWGLVCDQEYLLNMTETFFYVGNLSACLFCGYLSDKFGRRRVVMASAAICFAAGMQVAWIDHVYLYIAVRFFLGIGYVGYYSLETYRCETFSSKHRIIPMVLDPTWIWAGATIPWMSYALSSWRTLLLILYGINFLVIPATWIVPETPPWLIKKGRAAEAAKVLGRVAKSRRMTIDENVMSRVLEDESDGGDNRNNDNDDDNNENEENFRQAMRSRLVVVSLIVGGLTWAKTNLNDIGLNFTYGTLAGNRFLNFSLLQLSLLPSQAIGFLACRFLYRRPAMIIGSSIAGAGFLSVAVVRGVVGDVDKVAPLFRRIINISINILGAIGSRPYGLWIQEAFPTLIRARAFLIAMLFGRFSAIAASYLSYFQTRAPLAVETTLACANLLGAAIVIFVPETKGRPLPQSLTDMRRLAEETRRAPCRIVYWKRKVASVTVDAENERSKLSTVRETTYEERTPLLRPQSEIKN